MRWKAAVLTLLTLVLGSLPGRACETTDTVLCLNEGRFKVEANWRTPAGTWGVGHAVKLTSDSGYFWFFGPTNIELVTKVLDGRPVNNRFWVFTAGLTDVEVTMVVTDTLSGCSKLYRNPLRTAFQPMFDTGAFDPEKSCVSVPASQYCVTPNGSRTITATELVGSGYKIAGIYNGPFVGTTAIMSQGVSMQYHNTDNGFTSADANAVLLQDTTTGLMSSGYISYDIRPDCSH